MGFYEILSQYYDDIFPLSSDLSRFIQDNVGAGNKNILDIGCGTGDLDVYMARQGYTVKAIDLDQKMIEEAKKRAQETGEDIQFAAVDMRNQDAYATEEGFDGVLCLGNTLVHLQTVEEMEEVISRIYRSLGSKGMSIVQIINYDRILDQNVTELPLIETPRIRFERKYRYDPLRHYISFDTILQVKEAGHMESYSAQVPLYPLRYNELKSMMNKSGFAKVEWYGSFKGDLYTPSSYALIAVGYKE
jgi:glycine/sarcosine N-methyltransferase